MSIQLKSVAVLFVFSLILYGCASKPIIKNEGETSSLLNLKTEEFAEALQQNGLPFVSPRGTRIDTIIVNPAEKEITINLSRQFSYLPFREKNVKNIYDAIKAFYGKDFSDYKFSIRTMNMPIENLIPNFYRTDSTMYDYARIPAPQKRPAEVIRNSSKPYIAENGLEGKNILLWHSHGWYYNVKDDRWEWQRPRLFQSVEDLIPMSFTIPYLIPMLENAGANVFVPRERDTQTNEAVVDNDTKDDLYSKKYIEKSLDKKHVWKEGKGTGFANGNPPYKVDYNPFAHGTYKYTEADSRKSAEVSWIPDIPEAGYYSVYIAYAQDPDNITDAHYTVYHAGGKTEFRINQQIGGGTWEYLGEFKFDKGINPSKCKVVLSNESAGTGKMVTADGVRFGGGMGVVMRNGSTSGRPKFVEGARYYLQYLGMPDTLVYNLNDDKNDYNDDYQSRAEYGNFLRGAPFGPNKDRNVKGLGIPIDLSMAFHTDAGITHNDTVVGSLSIYSLRGAEGDTTFPDGVSRLASRDLADIVQTQIVNDMHHSFDPQWTRRELRNAGYSESFRPNFPALLLELLSHQNFLDMKYVLDPRFRFAIARAIYKGMLKFLSVQYDYKYAVQPLPVTHFATKLSDDGSVTLTWKPQIDSLEPTAAPDKYIIYTRRDGGGFDNGILTENPYITLNNLEPGIIYSYKVAAVNEGGRSFPSEILSVCWMNNNKPPVMIVNGFDRICGPASVNTPLFSGFLNMIDRGVPDKYNINFTGTQYDYNPASPYISNDAPGHGASHANYETKVIAGNSFDYPFIHGKSIKECGYSFVSSSASAVEDSLADLSGYKLVDLILGEQKKTPWQKTELDTIYGYQFKTFPSKLQKVLSAYLNGNGNLFVSGAYVATDLFMQQPIDSSDIDFAKNVLKYTWDADHAAETGKVFAPNSEFLPKHKSFYYHTALDDKMYAVEAPDAIRPVNGSETILRYYENKFSAATAFKDNYGVIVFGFPFETIEQKSERSATMKAVLKYFGM